jgi:hypothetical protein
MINNKNKISLHPPKLTKEEIIREKFIAEADKKISKIDVAEERDEILPWNDSSVRPDIKISFTLQIYEPYILKLRYISKKTNKSQQNIVREILEPAIDHLLKQLF